MKPLKNMLFWPVLFISQTIALALLCWHLLAQVHFAYPAGYQLLDLQSHIAEFAPLNRHKDDFELATKEDHWRLFGEISDAVQNHGEGLRDIRYRLANGETTAFMHEAEIIHLQDVANVIDIFYMTGAVCWLLWLITLAIAYWQRFSLPSPRKILLGFIGSLLVLSLIIIAIGPTSIFYWLHVQIFPDEHQWFFYYQDSLMTTLMKAPDIFAFICVLLVLLLTLFWGASFWGMKTLLSKPEINAPPAKNTRATNTKAAKKNAPPKPGQ